MDQDKDGKPIRPIDKFVLPRKLLEQGNDYGSVLDQMVQLWSISRAEAERQLTSAGLRRPTQAAPKTSSAPPKQKRAARPIPPIRWTTDLDNTLWLMHESGTSAKEIAAQLRTTESSINARVRIVRQRKAREEIPNAPAGPKKPGMFSRATSRLRNSGVGSRLEREMAWSFLGDFGVMGRVAYDKIYGRERYTPTSPRGRQGEQQGESQQEGNARLPGAHAIGQAIDKMAVATTRGVADLARRIDGAGQKIESALASIARASRSSQGGGAQAGGSGSSGRRIAGTAIGLGLIGAGATFFGSTSAEGGLHPSGQDHDPTPDDEGGNTNNDNMRVANLEFESAKLEFKADKIRFEADNIIGLPSAGGGSGVGPGSPSGGGSNDGGGGGPDGPPGIGPPGGSGGDGGNEPQPVPRTPASPQPETSGPGAGLSGEQLQRKAAPSRPSAAPGGASFDENGFVPIPPSQGVPPASTGQEKRDETSPLSPVPETQGPWAGQSPDAVARRAMPQRGATSRPGTSSMDESGMIPQEKPGAVPGGETPGPRSEGAIDRSKFAEELKQNPQLAAHLGAMLKGEVGLDSKGTDRQVMQLETLFNRAHGEKNSLTRALTNGYYPDKTFSRAVGQNEKEHFEKNVLPRVLGGSDLTREKIGVSAMDNASNDRRNNNMVAQNSIRRGMVGKWVGPTGEVSDVERPGYEFMGRKAQSDIRRQELPRIGGNQEPRPVAGSFDEKGFEMVEPSKPDKAPLREAVEQDAQSRVTPSRVQPDMVSPGLSDGPMSQSDTSEEPIDTSGPVFGGGKSPVPGRDKDLDNAWG